MADPRVAERVGMPLPFGRERSYSEFATTIIDVAKTQVELMTGCPNHWFRRLHRVAVRMAVPLPFWLSHQQHIVDEPGEHISEASIKAVIAQESPVLYRDGVTPIELFFSKEHRIYVEPSARRGCRPSSPPKTNGSSTTRGSTGVAFPRR